MSEDPKEPGDRQGLNPALKTQTDTTHDTSESSPSPASTTSVQREEGRGWPMVWLVATVVGVILAVWLLFF